jgi:uncharacterized protein YndB with AHSA1/START domain
MILRDEIRIGRPAREVWNYIENPEHMMSWNPKVKKVSPMSWSTERNLGFRYSIVYEMSGKASELQAEFTEYLPPSRLVIHLHGERLPREAYVEEIYELSEDSAGTTLLTQSIVMHNTGVNIFWRFIFFLISRFGHPVGKKYLETLREIIENNPGPERDKGSEHKATFP